MYMGFQKSSNSAMWSPKNRHAAATAKGGAPSRRATSHTSQTFKKWTACSTAT